MLQTISRLLATVICTLAIATLSFAAVPLSFNYQGYLKDTSTGEPVSTEVTITFSLYASETGVPAFWVEKKTLIPANGIYSVTLGATPENTLIPSTITEPVYLGITIGTDSEMLPRQVLTSSPFAIRAAVADSVPAGAVTSDSISGTINNTKLDLSTVVAKDGSIPMTGTLTIPGENLGLITSGANQFAIKDGKLGIGIATPTEKLDVVGNAKISGTLTAGTINSSVAQGTAPFTVASTTLVNNLNANLLNGLQASEIITAASDEVRLPISACGTTISSPGSYYITQNLTSAAVNCITVTSNNVTIDLKGFTLTGDRTAGHGIEINPASNVEIFNGTVRNFSTGVYASSTGKTSVRIINVRANDNAGSGIRTVGKNSTIKGCTVAFNGFTGIDAGSASIVTGSTSIGNGSTGISALGGSVVSDNISNENTGDGISINDPLSAGTGATVTNNSVAFNSGSGINSSIGSIITGNSINQNNRSSKMGPAGLTVGSNCVVKNNVITSNFYYNIYVTGAGNMIEENLVNGSTYGIYFAGSGNYFNNNRARGNTSNYFTGIGQTDGGGNVIF